MAARKVFFEETTYQATSDEWKEYEHEHSYYLDQKTGAIFKRTVTEFQNTRDGTSAVTKDDTVEIDRASLSAEAAAKLKEFESK
jgi:hypothetical protein